jgi:hypothetical protein
MGSSESTLAQAGATFTDQRDAPFGRVIALLLDDRDRSARSPSAPTSNAGEIAATR